MEGTANAPWDLVLNALTLVGAAVAFLIGLRQWRRSEEWKRAEKLDQLSDGFNKDERVRVATIALDWVVREVKYDGTSFLLRPTDVRAALNAAVGADADTVYTPEQVLLRDAYDALLAYFVRVEHAVSSGLIDRFHAQQVFGYWFERLLLLDRHSTELLNTRYGLTGPQAVARYIARYSDPRSMLRLAEHFALDQDAYAALQAEVTHMASRTP